MNAIYLFLSLIIAFLIIQLLLYPFFVRFRYFFRKKRELPIQETFSSFSVIMAIFNEEKFIENRINYFLSQKEWNSGCELLILSGGSTDKTNEILSGYSNSTQIIIETTAERIGKIKALNILVPKAKNEIILFSDCRQRIQEGAVKELLFALSDPTVGIAGAWLSDTLKGGKASWMREEMNRLNYMEGETDTAFNLYGALYVSKKSLFKDIPEHLLFDEPWVVLQTLAARKRVVMCSQAVIEDFPMQSYYSQERMERLARGLLLFLFREGKLFLKLKPLHAFRYFRYKYFKLLISLILPFWFLLTLVLYGNLIKDFNPLFVVLLGGILLVVCRNYLLFLIRLNVAFAVAWVQYIAGTNRNVFWEKLKF